MISSDSSSNNSTSSSDNDDDIEINKTFSVKNADLNDALDIMGNGSFQMGILFLTGLAEGVGGMTQLSAGFLLHFLGNLFHLTNHQKALTPTCSAMGMLCGATGWGRASDLYGRKYAFIGTLIMTGLFGLLCATAPTYNMFLAFRFLTCIGVGGMIPLAFTIFSEFSASKNRGGYLTLLEAFWSAGAVLACLLAWILMHSYGWRAFVISIAIPSLILGILSIKLMKETPRFLLVSGEMTKAQDLVKHMSKQNGNNRLKNITLKPSEATFEESSFTRLFSPTLITQTLTLFTLYFLLAYGCGIFVWMPVLLQAKKLPIMSLYRSMVIMCLSQIPGVVFVAYLVEVFGRRFAVGTSFLMGAIFTAIFAVSKEEHVIVSSTILMEFFLAGANGAISAITVELYPTTLRSSAMGACSSISRIGSIIGPLLWAKFLDINERVAIFAGATALSLGMLVICFLPETKGMIMKDHQK